MNQPPAKRPPLSEETVNKMLASQAKEQELKARELEIRQHELKAQAEFAHKMLDAQVGDRSSERTHISGLQKRRFIVGVSVLVIILIFLGYGLHLGYSNEVFEFAKLIGTTVIGAIGGYGYRANKDRQRNEDPPQEGQ